MPTPQERCEIGIYFTVVKYRVRARSFASTGFSPQIFHSHNIVSEFSVSQSNKAPQRTRVFFCAPMASWQKPHIERSHEYIRQIIPKGISMDYFTRENITLMLDHINSLFRDSLNGSCPFDAAKQLLGRKLPKLFGLKKIPTDNVILRPSLLKK